MEVTEFSIGEWKKDDRQVFWGEIAPCDHVVQIYENDASFMDLLASFVVGGIRAGETVIVIVTPEHLAGLNERLMMNGFDPFYLKLKDKYIPLDAADTLSKFMIKDWPDEKLFTQVITEAIVRAKRSGAPVRAFGEMVALLWAQGLTGATVQLEHLWNKICKHEPLSLFCAYPKSGFTEDPHTAMMQICGTHAKIIAAASPDSNDLLFAPIETQSKVI
jgi:hypothetical protein